MLSFHRESWGRYYDDPERLGLWTQHYTEFTPAHERRLPMEPDVSQYSALEKIGALEVMTVRKEGKMVGYCLVVFRRHLHYSSLCAFEDSYFLSKSERKGLAGYRFLRYVIQVCRSRGAKRLFFMTKTLPGIPNIRPLLERLGFVQTDETLALWLEGA